MRVTAEKCLKFAFVLTGERLDRIVQTLERFFGTASVNINCRDGLERKFANRTEFAAFDNARSKQIKDLWLHAFSTEDDQRAHVHFKPGEQSHLCESRRRGGHSSQSV